jgi:hypothetical protein
MHGHEKSDPAIVAVKPANKVEQLGAAAWPLAARAQQAKRPCRRRYRG